jgi:glucose/arabinose dehydrogenase/PKD repeat protein
MRRCLVVLTMAAALLAGAATAQAGTYPTGFQSRTMISGLTGATGIAFAPDGRDFVIEKAGKLKVVQPGASTATQILDLSNHVNDYGDRGLLGVAVDANFATNGYVFLLYTYDVSPLTPDSSSAMVSRLVRVQIAANGTVVNPGAPETVLIGSYTSGPCPQAANTLDCIPSDGSSHSIGSVRVASDGTLFVGSGDASDFNIADPLSYRTYDEQSYAGKILHVDRNGRGLPGHSFCPADANLDHVCAKLHVKGFRNPFRFTIRPNGGLMVGDVGWNTWEEVDLINGAGGNYGWPCYEATHHTPTHSATSQCAAEYAKEGTAAADVLPDYEYDRTRGSAVVGGPTYTGDQYPGGYRNSIFIGDYTSNTLRRLVLDAQGRVAGVQPFATNWIGTALELEPTSGDLISVNFGTGAPGDGFVERIVYASGNGAPTAQLAATPTAGAAPLSVNFSAAGSSDPDGDALSYAWDFGDGATATGSTAQHVYTQTGTLTATLTVSDGRGLSDAKTVTITPGGNAPAVTIDAPVSGALYADGDVIALRGSAQDQQDGTLPGSSLQWLVRLHHADHIHPIATLTGAQTSFQAVRDHDADSYYEITLIATDSGGLTSSKTVEIRPRTVSLQMQSTPAGAPLSYGGRAVTPPATLTTTIGYDTTVSAADEFIAGGHTYVFDSWSDGGAAVHDVRVPATAFSLRATYLQELAADGMASASSTEATGVEPAKALDGNGTTRWSSSYADNQWWQVDLGSAKQVSRVELDWETAYASSYEILTSTDGTNFSTAADETTNGAGTKATTFAARNARYVRVQGLTRATQWGISFYEARVLGTPAGGGDTTPPDTTITAGPTGTSASATASFSFTASETDSTFECRLDAGAWARCTSPDDLAGLADGSHSFDVRATDQAGNTDASPASRTWTVATSTTGENLALGRTASASSSETADLGPGNAVDGVAATRWSSTYSDDQWWQVDLGSAKQVSRVELDWEAAFASSYRILTSTDGTNFTAAAEATANGAGLKATTFTARSARYVRVLTLTRGTQWGISLFEARVFGPLSGGDTSPPDTTIAAGPSGTVSSASASFEFSSNEQGSTFECRLDGSAWAGCSSPRALSGLADGSHSFDVRATDQAGNADASPASRTWTVNTAAVAQDLAQGQPSTASSIDTAGHEAGKAVDGDAATRWSSNFTENQWWQVDLGSTKQVSRVELDWETAYASSYEILTSTDGTSFTQAAQATAPGPGTRSTTFTTRSARYVRVRSLTKATQWGISFFTARVYGSTDVTPPDTTITSGPSGTSPAIAPSFQFSASETGSSFQCRLDGGSWATCSSPRALSGLADGSHSFDVRATDQAGNTDASPASRTWTIDAPYSDRVLATSGLASFWRLGETTGTAAGDAKGTNAGTYTGGPTTIAGLLAGDANAARNFDGVDDAVDLAPMPFGTPTQVSAEAWVRIDAQKAAGGYHFLISDAEIDLSDGFTLAIDSAGRPVFTIASSATTRATAQSSIALTPNTVYHLVGTYDGQTARVYVDGVQRGSTAYTGGIGWHANRDLLLARQNAATNRATRYLDGRLDEAAIYTAALSATTVAAHNAAGR